MHIFLKIRTWPGDFFRRCRLRWFSPRWCDSSPISHLTRRFLSWSDHLRVLTAHECTIISFVEVLSVLFCEMGHHSSVCEAFLMCLHLTAGLILAYYLSCHKEEEWSMMWDSWCVISAATPDHPSPPPSSEYCLGYTFLKVILSYLTEKIDFQIFWSIKE